MIYADTDFFLALLKPQDWLKENAKRILKEYGGQITTSVATFIELMFLSKKFNLDPVELTVSVMEICKIRDERLIKAALYIKHYGLTVLDAFHAAFSEGVIISSDSVFDKIGLKRIRLEGDGNVGHE
ncbi:PIN domain-containing protein [Pyrococcus kukulkanii]|uniref:Pilus assembly protein n=1 Tax=Pyrococcus kukulkanii TaxID=1609559 RepID=A0A127B7K7_9EURY|nr:PIN domain-containing protein [Pyrococcus kukulkanii]AMM53360.1 pilus assembly protein [Pyrococcus kukulkanii]